MLPHHHKAIQVLSSIGIYFAPWEGQFIHGLKRLPPEAELSQKQVEQVERMAIKFRKRLNRHGYAVPHEILEPYYERRRRQRTPDDIKFHWVKERQP